MKSLRLLTMTLFLAAAPTFAGGPWLEVSSNEPALDTGESVAIEFIRTANQGDYDDAASLMTAAYVKWREALDGLSTYLDEFRNADLARKFNYRIVSADAEFTRIDVRFFSTAINRDKNHRINVIRVDNKWKLTYKH